MSNIRFQNPINGYHFGQCLIHLYQLKNIDTSERGWAPFVAKEMFKYGIIQFNDNKSDTYAKRNQSSQKEIVSRRLQEHLKTESAKNVAGYWLERYCRYFRCSCDYLMGYIEKPTYADTDIYKETGLSEYAVNTLAAMKNFNKDYDQYRKPVELEALNFIMKDSEKFREFIGYISALFIGADKAFYRDKEDKKWRFISDSIHVTYPTSKNSNEKQTANTGLLNIKSLAETDCIRHIELLLEDWKQEFKK